MLIGMMGSGKTTVGEALAKRLGRPFFDSDAMIEARTGQTVAEIFAARGEAAFRVEESEALVDSFASSAPAVIAAAGGVVLDPANRLAVARAGLVVWLRADAAELAGRVHPGDHRPLISVDPEGSLRRLAAERDPLYESLADLVIDVAASDVTQTVATIDAALAGVA